MLSGCPSPLAPLALLLVCPSPLSLLSVCACCPASCYVCPLGFHAVPIRWLPIACPTHHLATLQLGHNVGFNHASTDPNNDGGTLVLYLDPNMLRNVLS